MFLVGLAVPTDSVFARAGEHPPERAQLWRSAVEALAAVDARIREGDREGVRESLDRLTEAGWPAPLGEVPGRVRRSFLEEDVNNGTLWECPGVERLLNSLWELDEPSLVEVVEDEVLGHHPECREAGVAIQLRRANRVFRDGRVEEALEVYRRVARDVPRSAQHAVAVFNTGISLRDLRRFGEAIEAFREVLTLDVDNRELIGDSIMEMDYQNYHHRSALNISWCYEALGRPEDAYRWVELARTRYPYEFWCSVEVEGNRRFLAATAERIAFSAGGSLALRRLVASFASSWPGWTLWACWAVVIAWGRRRRSISFAATSFGTAAVGLVAALGTEAAFPYLGQLQNLRYRSDLAEWIPYLLALPVPALVMAVAAVLAEGRPKLAAGLGVAGGGLGLLAGLFEYRWYLSDLRYFPRMPLADFLVAALTLVVPPVTLVAATLVGIHQLANLRRRARQREATGDQTA